MNETGLPLRMRDNGGLDWGGRRRNEGGEGDDDFAQSANLLSPPGHAALAANDRLGAENETPSILSLDVDRSAKHPPGNGRGGERQKLKTLLLILASCVCLPTCPPSVVSV